MTASSKTFAAVYSAHRNDGREATYSTADHELRWDFELDSWGQGLLMDHEQSGSYRTSGEFLEIQPSGNEKHAYAEQTVQ